MRGKGAAGLDPAGIDGGRVAGLSGSWSVLYIGSTAGRLDSAGNTGILNTGKYHGIPEAREINTLVTARNTKHINILTFFFNQQYDLGSTHQ